MPTLKIAHSVSSASDRMLPQSDIDSVHGRCAADYESWYWRI